VVGKISAARDDWQKLAQIQAGASNALVQKTRTEYLGAREKLAAVARRYGPKHPTRINAETIHRESEASYVAQVNAAATNIQSNFDLANQRVRDLSKFTNENRNELQQLDRKTYELRILEREVDANRKLYDLFLSKLKETDLSDDFQTVNAIVVDAAHKPGAPSAPQRLLIIAASFVVTFLLLYCAALLRWMLDKTVSDPDQLKEKLPGTVLLGGVPIEKALTGGAGKGLSKALQKSPKFTEAVQSIRTSLLLCEPDKPNQVVMLTSALPSEGKTTLSVALAASFGRLTKTLVIEADMRRPKFPHLLGAEPNQKGLAQVLVNNCELEDAIRHHEGFGVDYLPAGAMPPNPLELLGSQRFSAMLEQLRGQYQRIVVDCPPVAPVSDTLLLASQADAMAYVLRADETSTVVAADSLASLEEAGARIVGIVLNALDTQRLSKYYGGRYAAYGAAGYSRVLSVTGE
ncbi:MAG: polysaccharide biosynthesis tyrosine autokinase, partial [Gammaproteobacteria bacterium]|nr:polysaccharide biosynthesis tyrosine autokinase [Gammaproteobacteria bacterium]